MNDLERIEAKVDTVITKLEAHLRVVDGFDDRIARAETLAEKLGAMERSLASTAMRLAFSKALTGWVPGALAGAVAGAVVSLILAGVASAR